MVQRTRVLILVLMEDTLRVRTICPKASDNPVLILVLMEDTLRGERSYTTMGYVES